MNKDSFLRAFSEYFRRSGPTGLFLFIGEIYVVLWMYSNRQVLDSMESVIAVMILFFSFMFLEKLNRIDRALWKIEEDSFQIAQQVVDDE